MQNDSTTTNANGWESPQAGVTLDGSATVGPSEPTSATGATPIAVGDAEEGSMDPGTVVPATTLNSPVQAAELTD